MYNTHISWSFGIYRLIHFYIADNYGRSRNLNPHNSINTKHFRIRYGYWHPNKMLISSYKQYQNHDDVIKWKNFPRYWPFVRGIHRWPVNSPRKGQWRGVLMSSLICAWINGWVNNAEVSDLRRHHANYDVIVMYQIHPTFRMGTTTLL